MPKVIDNIEYIDGGVRVNTPVKILKQMGAKNTIAVTFDCNKRERMGAYNFIGVSEQAFNLLSHSSNECEQDMADINLRLCISNVSLLDFSKTSILVQRGYNLVARNIQEIKKRLEL